MDGLEGVEGVNATSIHLDCWNVLMKMGQGRLHEVMVVFEGSIEEHVVEAAVKWIAACCPLRNFFEIQVVI